MFTMSRRKKKISKQALTVLLLGRDLRRWTRGFSWVPSESSELELDIAGSGLISTFANSISGSGG
jgi:hypothetical protein